MGNNENRWWSYQSKAIGALAARRKLWLSSAIEAALALPTRAKAAWVRAKPAMALVEVIDDNNRGGNDHLEHGPLPFGSGAGQPRRSPWGSELTHARIRRMSPVYRWYRRAEKVGGAELGRRHVDADLTPLSRSAGRSRRGPSAWPRGRAG